MTALWVFIGGGIGALLRYGVIRLVDLQGWHGWVATICVNVVGSFLLGWLTARFSESFQWNESFRFLLAIGLCGGFTTFSTFSMDAVTLLRNGAWVQAAVYILLSIALSFLAMLLALYVVSHHGS